MVGGPEKEREKGVEIGVPLNASVERIRSREGALPLSPPPSIRGGILRISLQFCVAQGRASISALSHTTMSTAAMASSLALASSHTHLAMAASSSSSSNAAFLGTRVAVAAPMRAASTSVSRGALVSTRAAMATAEGETATDEKTVQRLLGIYQSKVVPAMQEEYKYTNTFQVCSQQNPPNPSSIPSNLECLGSRFHALAIVYANSRQFEITYIV